MSQKGFEVVDDVSLRKASILSTGSTRSVSSPAGNYDYEPSLHRSQQHTYPTLTHAYRTTSALPLPPPTSPPSVPVSPYVEGSGRDHPQKLKDLSVDFTIHRRSPLAPTDSLSDTEGGSDGYHRYPKTSRLHYQPSSSGMSSYGHDSFRRGITPPSFRSPPGGESGFGENGLLRHHEVGKERDPSQGLKDILRYKDVPKPNALIRFQCRNLPQYKPSNPKERYVCITFNDVQQQTLVMQTEWTSDVLNPRFESTLELRELEPYYTSRAGYSSDSQFMICIYRGQHILAHTEKIGYSVLLSLHNGSDDERHVIFPLKNWHDEGLERRLKEIRSEVVLSVSPVPLGGGGPPVLDTLRSPPLKLLADPYLGKRDTGSQPHIYPSGSMTSPPPLGHAPWRERVIGEDRQDSSYGRPPDISFSSSIMASPELDVKFKADMYVIGNSGSNKTLSARSGGASVNSSPSTHPSVYSSPPFEESYARSPPPSHLVKSTSIQSLQSEDTHSPHRAIRKFTYYQNTSSSSSTGPSPNPSRSQFTIPNDSPFTTPPTPSTISTLGLPSRIPESPFRPDSRLESRAESRLEPRSESRLEGRSEGRLEGRSEGRLEGRSEGRSAPPMTEQRPLTKEGGGYAFRLRRKVLEAIPGDESAEEDRDNGEEVEDVRMFVEEYDSSPTLLVWTRDPELEFRPKEERSVPLYRLTRMHGSRQEGAFSIVYKQKSKRETSTTDQDDSGKWERVMLKLQARNSMVRNYWLKSLHPMVMKERNIQKLKQQQRHARIHRGSAGGSSSLDGDSSLDDYQEEGSGSGTGLDFSLKELSITEPRRIPSREQLKVRSGGGNTSSTESGGSGTWTRYADSGSGSGVEGSTNRLPPTRAIYGRSQSRQSSSSIESSGSDEYYPEKSEKERDREPERSKSEQTLPELPQLPNRSQPPPRVRRSSQSTKEKPGVAARSQSEQTLSVPYTPIVTETMDIGEYEEKLRTTDRLNPTVALATESEKRKLADKKKARKSFAVVKAKGGDEGKKTELTDCMMMGIRGVVKHTLRAMSLVVDVSEREGRAHPEEFDLRFCLSLPFPAAGTKNDGNKTSPPTPPPSSSTNDSFVSESPKKITVTPKHGYKDFEFKEYFGTVFARLRQRWGISTSGFLKSVATRSSSYHDFIPNSKSGNLFFLTRDGKYMLKSQTTSETKFLRRILRQYYQHMTEHPKSLLSRIAGMYRLTSPRYGQVHFIVMTNVFYAKRTIHLRFDLKGSTYGRNATEEEKKSKQPVFKDLDLMEMQTKLKLTPKEGEIFLESTRTDSKFLASLEIMDYSLLLGIHYKNRQTFEEDDDDPEKHAGKEDEDHDSDFEAEEGDDFYRNEEAQPLRDLRALSDSSLRRTTSTSSAFEDEALMSTSGVVSNPSSSSNSDDNGQLSADASEIYYMGIIDILQQFNIRKKGEALYKTTLRDSMSQSCVEPQLYASRFHGFLSKHVQILINSPEQSTSSLPSSSSIVTPTSPASSDSISNITPPRLQKIINSTSSPQLAIIEEETNKKRDKVLKERSPPSGVVSPYRQRSDSSAAGSASTLSPPPPPIQNRHYVAASLPKNFTLGSLSGKSRE